MKLSQNLTDSARFASNHVHAGFLRECGEQARLLENYDLTDDVYEAHFKFDSERSATPVRSTTDVDLETRRQYIREEFEELMAAIDSGKMTEIVGEIVDLIYVLVGTLVVLGLPLKPFWNAVHRANMAKVSSGIPGGKWVKPAGWLPANLNKILHRLRQTAVGME